MGGAMKKAVVLLSGGLDSATALAIAKSEGYECYALTADYGQRHAVEIVAANDVAAELGAVAHEIVDLNLLGHLAASALTWSTIEVPKVRTEGVPTTYVPARNTVLLSLALAWAETLGAEVIFTGFNVLDASGYPDCRQEFVDAFNELVKVATKEGSISVRAPLIRLSKAEIISRGIELGLDYSLTRTCYDPVTPKPRTKVEALLIAASGSAAVKACGQCDACVLRRKGFEEAGVPDPTKYI